MTNKGNGCGQQIIFGVAVAALLVLIYLGVRQNQFLPLPGQKVPVVPQLPAIAAETWTASRPAGVATSIRSSFSLSC
jgi:hypothetical protein